MTPATPRNAVLLVILIIGIATLGGLGAITWLASTHTPIPTVLETTTASAFGALAAILSSTRTVPNNAGGPPPNPAPPAA